MEAHPVGPIQPGLERHPGSLLCHNAEPETWKKEDRTLVAKAIITEIWTQWMIVWEIRNKDLHGATETARARAEREEVERTLRDVYDLREQMEPSVHQPTPVP